MRYSLKKVLPVTGGVSLICVIVFYAYFQARAVIAGPEIVVFAPTHGSTSTSSLVRIEGTSRRAKELTILGRPIFIDLNGNFSEALLLAPGYNIIELTARDAQGRSIRNVIEVIHEPQGTITP